MPLPKPAEFTEGAPLERLDAERQRRRTSAQAMGYGGVAAGSGLASAGLANLKVAGTDVGQAGLSAAQAKTRRKSPEAAQQIGRLRDAGKWARANRGKTLAGTAGLAGLSGVSGIAGRHKQNEEQGMSQEIGRLRAGERYAATRRNVKKDIGLRTMLLATDYDLASPRARKAIAFADRNKKKIAGGASASTAAGAGGAVANERIQRSRQHRQLERMAKAERRRPDGVTAGLTGVGLAGWGAGMGSKQISHRVNQRHLANTDKKISRASSEYGLDRNNNPVPQRRMSSDENRAFGERIRSASPEEKKALSQQKKDHNAKLSGENKANLARRQDYVRRLGESKNVPRMGPKGRTLIRAAGYGLGGASLYAAGSRHVEKYDRSDLNSATVGSVVGASAAGAGSRADYLRDRRKRDAIYDKNPKLKAELEDHKRKSGLRPNAAPDDPAWNKVWQNLPKHHPMATKARISSRVYAGPGALLAAGAATAAGGAAGVKINRGRKNGVSKSYYAREERVSPLRAGQYAAGLGVAAAGLSRSGMVGRALAHGVRQAELGGNRQAVTALQRAMAMRGQIRAGTAPSIAQMRKIKQIDNAVSAVPRGMRAEVAAAAGLLMASNARPVRQTSYRPVGRY